MDVFPKFRAIVSYLRRSVHAQILLTVDSDTCQYWAIQTSLHENIITFSTCRLTDSHWVWHTTCADVYLRQLSARNGGRRCIVLRKMVGANLLRNTEWQAQIYCAAHTRRRKLIALHWASGVNSNHIFAWYSYGVCADLYAQALG